MEQINISALFLKFIFQYQIQKSYYISKEILVQ